MVTKQYPHTISWFEIPATDLARATSFYETILDISMEKSEMDDFKMSIFPSGDSTTMTVHGALVKHKDYIPHNNGPMVYFNTGEDLTTVLTKVEGAGGKIKLPKTSIGKHGYMAWIEDTESNRVALHSMN